VLIAGSSGRGRLTVVVCLTALLSGRRRGGQPARGWSVESFPNAVVSAVADGQVVGRCSLARRPENARRPSVCGSRWRSVFESGDGQVVLEREGLGPDDQVVANARGPTSLHLRHSAAYERCPATSRRSKRLLGPLQALLVDG
jgi:hypothetical protein